MRYKSESITVLLGETEENHSKVFRAAKKTLRISNLQNLIKHLKVMHIIIQGIPQKKFIFCNSKT